MRLEAEKKQEEETGKDIARLGVHPQEDGPQLDAS